MDHKSPVICLTQRSTRPFIAKWFAAGEFFPNLLRLSIIKCEHNLTIAASSLRTSAGNLPWS